MFTLRIYLMGLVALVPNADGDNSLAIVLPTTPSRGEDFHQPMLIYPSVGEPGAPLPPQYDAKDIASAHGRSTVLAEDGYLSVGDKRFGGIVFDQEIVTLSTPSSATAFRQLVFAGGREPSDEPTGALPGTARERLAFDWIPNLGSVSPAFGRLRETLSDMSKSSRVAALLELPGVRGSVGVYSMAKCGGMIPVVDFQIEAMGGNRSVLLQAVAEVAVIELEMEGSSAQVDIQRIATAGGAASRRSVELKPSGGMLEVLLGNLTQVGGAEQECHLHHFGMYLDLVGDGLSMPVPRATGKKVSASEIDSYPVPDVIQAVSWTKDGESRQMCTLAVINPK